MELLIENSPVIVKFKTTKSKIVVKPNGDVHLLQHNTGEDGNLDNIENMLIVSKGIIVC